MRPECVGSQHCPSYNRHVTADSESEASISATTCAPRAPQRVAGARVRHLLEFLGKCDEFNPIRSMLRRLQPMLKNLAHVDPSGLVKQGRQLLDLEGPMLLLGLKQNGAQGIAQVFFAL